MDKQPSILDPQEQDANTNVATIVITMNLKTGQMSIVGNAIPDVDLTLRMLLEAAHSCINKEAQPQNLL